MSTCARCNGELGRERWWVDGREYHDQCLRSAEHWQDLDRLAEMAWSAMLSHPARIADNRQFASLAYDAAEGMLAERRRRRSL